MQTPFACGLRRWRLPSQKTLTLAVGERRTPNSSIPMAVYHLSVKTISRAKGRSATGAAAYRAGERIVDERTGIDHDYRRKSGVSHTELFTPANAPEWARDRAKLWNAAEQKENRKNSTVAREFEIALPHELDEEQRKALAQDFCKELQARHKFAVDLAIHEPGKEGDNRNHHAHILCTTRRMDENGFTEKTRELDNQRSGEVERWRERFAELGADALERAGHQQEAERFRQSHLTLDKQVALAKERGDWEFTRQNENREPTKHLGPKATAMERNGQSSERGEHNRAIKERHDNVLKLAETQSEIRGLQEEKRKQETYEKRFKTPEKWQDREQAILKNHAEMHEIKNKEKALQQKLDDAYRIIDTPVKTYDEHVRDDKQLREYADRITQYEEQLRHGQRQVNDLEARGLWSQMKVRLAEKGYLTIGETAKAVEYREKNAQALERSETLRDKREDELYTNPLEKQRIDRLITQQTCKHGQAKLDGQSYCNKIWELKGHHQRVHEHTQTLIDLENKESIAHNREQIERLKTLEKQIENTEKALGNTPETLPRKRDNTPLNNMEAAQHLPSFKAYNREWHEKYQGKIDEWKAFEKQKPELAERLLNGTTKTKYKLLEELKAAKTERYEALQRHASDPNNARDIEGIKQRYEHERSQSHPKQRLEQLKREHDQLAKSPARGGWRDVDQTQRMLRNKNNLHNSASKQLLNKDQRRTIKQERELEKLKAYKKRRKTKSRGQSKDWGMYR